jgi:hypothetical protein
MGVISRTDWLLKVVELSKNFEVKRVCYTSTLVPELCVAVHVPLCLNERNKFCTLEVRMELHTFDPEDTFTKQGLEPSTDSIRFGKWISGLAQDVRNSMSICDWKYLVLKAWKINLWRSDMYYKTTHSECATESNDFTKLFMPIDV